LKVVYSAIGQTTQLQDDLKNSLADSKRKSLFLNAISHDLRTPLNALILHADVADISINDPQELKAALSEIRASWRWRRQRCSIACSISRGWIGRKTRTASPALIWRH